MKRVLVVEDEERIRNIYRNILTEEGYDVLEAACVWDAYDLLNSKKIDLVLLDIRLPEIEGNVLFEVVEFFRIKTKVIVASVYPIDAQKRLVPGAVDYFDKSQGVSVFLEKVKSVLA